jgi:hypothetical protein
LQLIRLVVQRSGAHLPHLIHPQDLNGFNPEEKKQAIKLLGDAVTKLACEKLLQAPLTVPGNLVRDHCGVRWLGTCPDSLALQVKAVQGPEEVRIRWFTVQSKGLAFTAAHPNRIRIRPRTHQAGGIETHVVSLVGAEEGHVKSCLRNVGPRDGTPAPSASLWSFIKTYYR